MSDAGECEKRVTAALPEHLIELIRMDARPRGVSVSAVIRTALEQHYMLRRDGKRRLPFESLGRGGDPNLSRDMDRILAEEWADAIMGDR